MQAGDIGVEVGRKQQERRGLFIVSVSAILRYTGETPILKDISVGENLWRNGKMSLLEWGSSARALV
jgi:hypothetical protein